MQDPTSKRFRDTTRGRVLGLLRRGERTIEELAGELELTDNAIRAHLATLERDGLVQAGGVRRGPGAGKPASVHQISADADVRFSRAYAPVLTALLEELAGQLSTEQTEALLFAVGRRLAAASPRAEGSRKVRVEAAVALLNALGGDATIETDGRNFVVRGCGCPLSAAVSRRPETCRAMCSLLTEVIGAEVEERCEHGPRPQCRFVVPAA